MALLIEACDAQEWLQGITNYPVDLLSLAQVNLYANTFYCTQFLGKDIFEKAQPRAYRVRDQNQVLGWTLLYRVSDTKIRARGTVILPEVRQKGVGRSLILEACRLYPASYQKIISFTLENKLGFYQKSGFQVVSSFEPRAAELYSPQNQSYNLASESMLYLVERERP